jgi:hypothetical protein
MKKKMERFYLVAVYLMAFLVVLGGCKSTGGSSAASGEASPGVGSTPSTNSPVVQVCNDSQNVEFSRHLIDPIYIKASTRIGGVGGGGTEIVGRSYITPKDEYEGVQIPIYAPVDMDLIAVTNYIPPDADPIGYHSDWALTFEVTCDVSISLYHIKGVVDAIREVAPPEIRRQSAPERTQKRVHFQAGEQIGYYQKGDRSIAFDFIVEDQSVINDFINQERYLAQSSNILHIRCPYELFQSAIQDEYLETIGSMAGTRFPGAGCGTVMRDKLGAISGNWFLEQDGKKGFGENTKVGMYGSPLPIATDVDGTIVVGHIGANTDMRFYLGNPTYLDPEQMTGSHCYEEQGGGYVYFELVTNTEMKVYVSATGNCPNQFPADGYKTYYR